MRLQDYMRGGCMPRAQRRFENLEEMIDIPRPVAAQDAIGHDMRIARDPVTRRAEALAVDRSGLVAREIHQHRRDVGRVHRRAGRLLARRTRTRQAAFRDGVGHARRGARHNCIHRDAVLLQAVRRAVGQPKDSGLGGSIVRLARRAERRVRREVDDAAVLALAHVRARRTHRAEMSAQMNAR